MKKIGISLRKKRKVVGQYLRRFLKEAMTPMALITVIGFVVGLSQYMDNNKRLRQAATIEYLQGFHHLLENTSPKLLDTMNMLGYKGLDYRLDTRTLKSLLEANAEYRRELDNIMTYLNRFAIGCCYDNYFDESAAWATDCLIIVHATYALVPYFQIIEKESGRAPESYVCPFLRAMVYRWKTDNTMSKKYNRVLRKIEVDEYPNIKSQLFQWYMGPWDD